MGEEEVPVEGDEPGTEGAEDPKLMKRRKWGTVTAAAGWTLLGLALLAGSLVVAWDSGAGWFADWLSGVLVEIGAAVAVLVPLYWITRNLDRRVEQVSADTASTVKALTERVSSFEGDVERRLEDLVRSVSERLTEERDRDAAIREALREKEPTWGDLLEALDRAEAQGLISRDHPPRVAAGPDARGPYVSVKPDGDVAMPIEDRRLTFTVERFSGKPVGEVEWPRRDSLADVMVRIALVVESASGEAFEVAGFFPALSNLLEVASTSFKRRPIIQLCPPTWAVTTRGLVPYDRDDDRIWTHEDLCIPKYDREFWIQPWADEESSKLAREASKFGRTN